jgi:hypothetical protein
MALTNKSPGRGGARHRAWNATSKARTSHSANSTNRVSFEEINRAALRALPILLAQWPQSGKRVSREYLALNPNRFRALTRNGDGSAPGALGKLLDILLFEMMS